MPAGNTLAAACEYLRRGWRVLPAEAGAKQCYLKGWPDLDLRIEDVPKYFAQTGNVVVVTGARSRGLVDIDLDCPEAVALAELYLPVTEAIFGRPEKPQSHRIYLAPGLRFSRLWRSAARRQEYAPRSAQRGARRRRAPNAVPAQPRRWRDARMGRERHCSARR